MDAFPIAFDLAQEEEALQIDYTAAPTCAAFHRSNALYRGIMGPIGSGKSSACVIEVLYRALRQKLYKGKRRSRCAIVRNTFPMLRSTTIQTWQDWVPPDICRIVYHSPIEGNIKEQPIQVEIDGEPAWMEGNPHGYDMGNGEILDLEVWFFALDRPGDLRRLLSLELTFAWINEARELPLEVVRGVFSRTGRYPKKRDGGLNWRGIWMDSNPMPTHHWWYRTAEQKRPDGWEFFRQPGALVKRDGQLYANPKAENVKHQPMGYRYWTEACSGASPEWIKVNCLGDYGADITGKPVYNEVWNDERHVSGQPLKVWRGIPLRLAFDFGLTPACVIGQLLPTGQLQILREIVCERGGVGTFVKKDVLPVIANEFAGLPLIVHGDPSGAPHQDLPDVITPIVEVRQAGLPCVAAATNDLIVRLDSVNYFLQHWPDGKPGFLLDPTCVVLREGFVSGYQYAQVQVVSSEPRFREQPDKNRFSHPHDALQYLCMGARGVDPGNLAQIRSGAKVQQRDTWAAWQRR